MRSVLHLQWASFNQVKVLKENGYGSHGEYVGLDVKAMRTTKDEDSYKHLENRNFEALRMYVMTPRCGQRSVRQDRRHANNLRSES